MPFARSADRPPRTKRVSLSTRRNAVMAEGEPIDLRVMFGEQTRYQCPPCAVYFPVPSGLKKGDAATCTKCGSVYVAHDVTMTGTVLTFAPKAIHRIVKNRVAP